MKPLCGAIWQVIATGAVYSYCTGYIYKASPPKIFMAIKSLMIDWRLIIMQNLVALH